MAADGVGAVWRWGPAVGLGPGGGLHAFLQLWRVLASWEGGGRDVGPVIYNRGAAAAAAVVLPAPEPGVKVARLQMPKRKWEQNGQCCEDSKKWGSRGCLTFLSLHFLLLCCYLWLPFTGLLVCRGPTAARACTWTAFCAASGCLQSSHSSPQDPGKRLLAPAGQGALCLAGVMGPDACQAPI